MKYSLILSGSEQEHDGLMNEQRNPKMDPRKGDIFTKGGDAFLVTNHTQGCVYVHPSLSAHREWIGLLFFREWAAGAEIYHAQVSA
jgi:hypothetical protein